MWTSSPKQAPAHPIDDNLDESYDTIDCDVLIVGAGGAGMRAAIECFDRGVRVFLVCKSLLGKAHTVMAEGGIAASLANVDPQDNWKVHFSDTIVEGQSINNWKMAEIFAKEAPDRVIELEHYGALFDRTPSGKIMQRPFGAHSYRRLCYVGDRTGLELIRTLEDQVVKRNIPYEDEVVISGIFKDKSTGAVSGALGIRIRTGEIIRFRCNAVVLATGGCGKVYEVTSNSWESTGDGIALAYRAGAELMDMEMIQFHPTGMIYPAGVRGMLVTEAVRGEGGILTNARGERFMENYDPKRKELSARDVVARSIYTEIMAGRGTKNGAVYLDVTQRGADYIKKKLPSMYFQFLEFAGIDITKEKMEVAPTVHYQMGGVKVDPETCETSVTGLYAAGEVASGLHGANRLGGNSLSDILVFGRRAGIAASEYIKQKNPKNELSDEDLQKEISRILSPFRTTSGANPFELKERIAAVMWHYVGIVRKEEDLQRGLDEIGKIRLESKNVQAKGPRAYNQSWADSLAVWNMVLDCESIIRSAIARKESRGAHTRSDYPNKDDSKWMVNIIIKRSEDGQMTQETVPVPKMPPDYEALLNREEILAWKANVKEE
ncbi:MAG TPA: FAD-binding protein [Nitrososphaerales archaeon]|nr:FAD-binding protein [Nitrososphaerales archaeon]